MKEKLHVWMLFEIISTSKELTEKSLKDHISKLKEEEGVEVVKETFEEISEIEKPHPKVDKGYSQICEVEILIDSFSKLFLIVMNYGPSVVEVIKPQKITLELSEVQDALNYVANMMHKFLEAGIGGVIILSHGEEK
jgi:hypothetical protein